MSMRYAKTKICPEIISYRNIAVMIIIITAVSSAFILINTESFWRYSVPENRETIHFKILSDKPNYTSNIVTVVTAYYPVPSKHNHSEYLEWINNFLSIIPCHLYIYTTRNMYPKLRHMRSNYTDRSRFIVREFDELAEYAKMDKWNYIKSIDPEWYHTPEVYVVWNQKWRFVQEAIEENAFNSEYFLWCDIGSFRDTNLAHLLKTFPNVDVVRNKLQDHSKLTFNLMSPYNEDERGNGSFWLTLRNGNTFADHVGGGIVAGHKEAWAIWIRNYYNMQVLFFKLGLNGGKEQNLMNAVVVRSWNNVQLVRPESYFNGTGNPWFYLQYYFS
ncbi:uncharacterized protein LOC129594940 [Paramacrobiotus metropolitanus]|uniref:uncharacterized protein LOC129594940 n=1 Tax=Paramacrobiotus metropolitanus TaxID=2943436 RepID=UPI002445AFEB|nr:uncharacterized protein LOC129594940 [Paramacrobiotus metropolitanus]